MIVAFFVICQRRRVILRLHNAGGMTVYQIRCANQLGKQKVGVPVEQLLLSKLLNMNIMDSVRKCYKNQRNRIGVIYNRECVEIICITRWIHIKTCCVHINNYAQLVLCHVPGVCCGECVNARGLKQNVRCPEGNVWCEILVLFLQKC